MTTTSSRIWTQVIVSVSYNNNHESLSIYILWPSVTLSLIIRGIFAFATSSFSYQVTLQMNLYDLRLNKVSDI